MLSPRTLTLSWILALALPACDNPSPGQQTPPPAAPTPAPDAKPSADLAAADEHYLKALELESAGRYVEARAEVDHALAAGAGRDAKLLAAKLAILRNDLEDASRILAPLAVDASDALVQYNVGLVAQRRNEYNRSRSAYLAAIKADPNYAPARFNLAILTWDNGVKEEAQHHARKFLELSPGDPRAAELAARVQLEAGPAAPAPPGGDPTATPTKVRDARAQPGLEPLDPSAKTAKKSTHGLKNPFDADKAARKDRAADAVVNDPLAEGAKK